MYGTGKAQDIILNALGIHATSFAHAEHIFAELGIVVKAVRVGRTSQPRVSARAADRGGWNAGGDGESYAPVAPLTAEQRAALAPYWQEKEK